MVGFCYYFNMLLYTYSQYIIMIIINININMKKQLFVYLLLTICVTANHHLNDKYKYLLEGPQPLTQAQARNIYEQYQSTKYQKTYYRFKVFYNNLISIKAHNSQSHSWTQGINDFVDITFAEFVHQKLMEPQNCKATNISIPKTNLRQTSIPDSHQWNDLGMVTPVKNQGNCGSCWSFSTVAAMESHWNILEKGKNITFSQQQLIDCASDFDNHGCFGGLPSHAFEYIRYNGGLQSDKTYPYVAHSGKCKNKPERNIGYCKYGSYNITQGNEVQLAEKLYKVGPMSVTFHVLPEFLFYKGGVYSHKRCGTEAKDVNHAVLATGYGIQKGLEFWNVKNSWGSSWGMNGYFKIQRNVNMCAISQCNSYPLIDSLPKSLRDE